MLSVLDQSKIFVIWSRVKPKTWLKLLILQAPGQTPQPQQQQNNPQMRQSSSMPQNQMNQGKSYPFPPYILILTH